MMAIMKVFHNEASSTAVMWNKVAFTIMSMFEQNITPLLIASQLICVFGVVIARAGGNAICIFILL